MPSVILSDELRSLFAESLSVMYQREVPLYKELLLIVQQINQQDTKDTTQSDSMERIALERHGAIRVGTKEELRLISRIFAVMGMYPVGYYDLTVRDLPIHSTAFRPVEPQALAINPFRMFCSLLRVDLLSEQMQTIAHEYLSQRVIYSDALIELLAIAETDGLSTEQADSFIGQATELFRWHAYANVSKEIYQQLINVNSLVADIIGFKGPHINHLTPRVLDIDQLHAVMLDKGHAMIPSIQGPPARSNPILLRQTSFKALDESILFQDKDGKAQQGNHRARFGEIEHRGVALTKKGRELYDQLLQQVEQEAAESSTSYTAILERVFQDFPDDQSILYQQKLAYYRFVIKKMARTEIHQHSEQYRHMQDLINTGFVAIEPITYEDFLPVSAAGIFKSNLVEGENIDIKGSKGGQHIFEQDLGRAVIDPFELYEQQQVESIEEVAHTFGVLFDQHLAITLITQY